jgi:hypothetical protein
MSPLPEGLDPTIQTREIVFEADASLVTLKRATVSRSGQGHMTFASDEGPASAASARRRRRSCTSAPR